MKTTILLSFIFISILSIHAQEEEYRINKIQLYDFCHCDYIYPIDSNDMMKSTRIDFQLINSSERVKLKTLYNRNTIISVRFSFNNNLDIEEEYIRLDADTFHYTQYNNSGHPKIPAEGNYYFDKSDFLIDSSHHYSYDPDDLHLIHELNIYHLHQKVKHGYWREEDSTTIQTGYYNHGKREGLWMFHGLKLSKKEVLYKNGVIVHEKELNLIRKEDNLKELEDILIHGTWRKHPGISSWILQKSNQSNIQFFKDFTYKSRIPPYSSKTGKWKILLHQKILVLDHFKYHIEWFSADMLQLSL